MPSKTTLLLALSFRRLRKVAWPHIIRAAIFAAFLVTAFTGMPSSALAWGCKGHQVIALIAVKHLNPRALAMAKKVLADGPVDPSLSRYCKEGGSDPLADASTWPDDIRPRRPDTPPWHYIDIPRGASVRNASEVEQYCDPKESCVTRAIRDQIAILRSPDATPQNRGDALRFLIHFVGDLHQPLHAVTNNDEGGNCMPVAFFEDMPQLRNPQSESYAPNLHGVWDTNILEKATTGKSVEQVAEELDREFHGQIPHWEKDANDADVWALESFRLAEKDVYRKLPVGDPIEAPQTVKSCADDNHVSTRLLKLDERLLDPYQTMAVPIVRERLAQAGARLAAVLNQLWPTESK